MMNVNEVIKEIEKQMGRELTDFERAFVESFKETMDNGIWSKQNGQAEDPKGDIGKTLLTRK